MVEMAEVIYTFEIALRFFVLGIRAVCDHWVKFDLVLATWRSRGKLLRGVAKPSVASLHMPWLKPARVWRLAVKVLVAMF